MYEEFIEKIYLFISKKYNYSLEIFKTLQNESFVALKNNDNNTFSIFFHEENVINKDQYENAIYFKYNTFSVESYSNINVVNVLVKGIEESNEETYLNYDGCDLLVNPIENKIYYVNDSYAKEANFLAEVLKNIYKENKIINITNKSKKKSFQLQTV